VEITLSNAFVLSFGHTGTFAAHNEGNIPPGIQRPEIASLSSLRLTTAAFTLNLRVCSARLKEREAIFIREAFECKQNSAGNVCLYLTDAFGVGIGIGVEMGIVAKSILQRGAVVWNTTPVTPCLGPTLYSAETKNDMFDSVLSLQIIS